MNLIYKVENFGNVKCIIIKMVIFVLKKVNKSERWLKVNEMEKGKGRGSFRRGVYFIIVCLGYRIFGVWICKFWCYCGIGVYDLIFFV